MHCLASFLLQDISLHEFAFEGTNYAKVCLKTFLCFLQLSDRAYVSKCWGFQTKHAIELQNCKHINIPSLLPHENKNLAGSLVLDFKKG